jgi:hypothetical protein
MAIFFDELEPLIEQELAGRPEIPVALAGEVAAAMQAIVVRISAESGTEQDLVLRDLSGHHILLELKESSAAAQEVTSQTIGEGASAVLSGSVAGTLARLMAEWSRQNLAFRDVLDALAPKDRGSLSAVAVLQARRNAEARRELLSEFPALTSAEVAGAAGSRAANRASLANRWRDEGKVFAIRVGEQQLYPAFQFDEHGRPVGTVASVLAAFDSQLTDWQTALWFTAPTGWLGGRRPVDAIAEEPESVIEAAAREMGELVA